MWKLILLSTTQAGLLTASQIFLKIAMQSLGPFSFTWAFVTKFIATWQMALSGICIAAASVVWFYILRHFPFSIAYPMISLSYVFGMLAAVFIFKENVPMLRWMGLLLIIGGVILIAKQ